VEILVAEDELDIVMQYEVALKSRGHDVIVKSDGQACLDAYLAALQKTRNAVTPFDVVILDYRMPEKDGLQAAGRLARRAEKVAKRHPRPLGRLERVVSAKHL
jgi:CheY-like chemotaxis protein